MDSTVQVIGDGSDDGHTPGCPSCDPKSLSSHITSSCRLHSPTILNHSSISSQSSESASSSSSVSSSSPLRKSSSASSRNVPIIVILLLLITSTFSILYVIEKVRDNKVNLLKLFSSKEAPYSLDEDDDELFHPSEVIVKTCTTLECIRAAEQISLIMDKSSNPCTDFYQFSCGRWKQHFSIPDDQSSYNTFSLMKDQLRVSLKG